MNKTQIGIAILPPEEYALFVRRKEIDLAKRFNTIRGLLQPPHITIKWPFETESIAPFEAYCKKLVEEIKPFDIEVNGYGFFEPKAIFLKVVSSKDLVSLHLNILNDLKKQFKIEKNPFEGPNQQFHTTLAYEDLSEEMFHKAKEELEKQATVDQATKLIHQGNLDQAVKLMTNHMQQKI